MSCIFYSAVTVYEQIIYRNEQKHRINYLELSHRQRKKFWNSFLITKVYEEGKIIWKRGLRNLFFIYGLWVFFISHIRDIGGVAVLFIFRSVVLIFILKRFALLNIDNYQYWIGNWYVCAALFTWCLLFTRLSNDLKLQINIWARQIFDTNSEVWPVER